MQADGMSHKLLIIIVTIILLSNLFISLDDFKLYKADSSEPPKIYVHSDNSQGPWDGSSGHPYRFIQDAINSSSPGDRIIVLNGTYNKILTIPHKLDIFGEDRDITIINGKNNGDVITISAQNVNISRFTIKNSGTNSDNSIICINSGKSIITDNKITEGSRGITLIFCF